jgi:shikimate kinase / 3-dehydroquinate synthase
MSFNASNVEPAPVFLTGMPGSGKTTVGRILARLTHRDFLDLDAAFLATHGHGPAESIREEGEALFRQKEQLLFSAAATRRGVVVSCGGGTLVDEKSRRQARDLGVVVHLEASLTALAQRLKDASHHPLLEGTGLAESLSGLLQVRRAAYRDCDFAIDTSCTSPFATAAMIQQRLLALDGGSSHAAAQKTDSGSEICVSLGRRSYPVWITESRELGELPRLLSETAAGRRPFVVGDEKVLSLYGKSLFAALGIEAQRSFALPEGEKGKQLSHLEGYLETLLGRGVSRDSVLVAVGGGAALDAAGFAASIYMRGIPCLYVATTLLAAVDAAIGGKTAMDLAGAKNIPGSFTQPAGVLVPCSLVVDHMEQGAPDGYGELLKSWLLTGAGAERASWMVRKDGTFYRSRVASAIAEAVVHKAGVVAEDEQDHTGARATLNLGHTFAHALESASGYRISHGRAVAWGLVVACRISEKLGLAESGLAIDVQEAARRLGLWPPPDSVDGLAALKHVGGDKKAGDGDITMVLLERPGMPVLKKMKIEVTKKLMAESLGPIL